MAEEQPYSLLIRLGVILGPILAGVLVWSYYHPPAAIFSPKKPSVTAAPVPVPAPNLSELAAEPAETIADPVAAAAPVAMPAAAAFSEPDAGGFRGAAMPKPVATPGGTVASTHATPPAVLGPRQQSAAGPERRKARDARKQEAASAHKSIQKLDKEISRKLSICSGC